MIAHFSSCVVAARLTHKFSQNLKKPFSISETLLTPQNSRAECCSQSIVCIDQGHLAEIQVESTLYERSYVRYYQMS